VFASLTDNEFRALHSAAKSARLAGSKLVRWKAGDTEVEKELTFNWSNPSEWAALDAEFCVRFPEEVARPRRTRTRAVFSAA
jgi:hypothetical protein